MPIYEYQCTHCNHCFDMMQKISEDPIKQCPVCYQNTVQKLISAAGFQLKGTGWYATDFKNKSSKSPENTAKNDASLPTDTAKGASSIKSTQDGDNK
jgi:putative FmdB family regulatory protein